MIIDWTNNQANIVGAAWQVAAGFVSLVTITGADGWTAAKLFDFTGDRLVDFLEGDLHDFTAAQLRDFAAQPLNDWK